MIDRPDTDRLFQANYTATSLDDMPVEDLIRLTRDFIRRVTNEDRQRLARDLRLSGHQAALRHAPPTLQRFFAGETDLDAELAQRYVHAPLLSHARFVPTPGEPVRKQTSAYFSSQDDSALMTVGAPVGGRNGAVVEFTFTLMSMVGLGFRVDPLTAGERRRWLELIRRENGITALWTLARWEKPYLIFVVRDYFARVYAFAPSGFEAAARLTPDMLVTLADWLEAVWFPPRATEDEAAERPTLLHPPGDPGAAWGGQAGQGPDTGDALPGDFAW
ncbi:MAG: hypothetical protein AAGU78_06870 [Chloroflexota bacterium]|nr:hypothetical protein [Anaerolineae bacterium]HMM29799.1 hypothetical protein [Aggregatilineaceae bacterium]